MVATTVSGQITLLGAGGQGGRVSDAVVYLEPIAVAPAPAPAPAPRPAPVAAAARTPTAPRDTMRLLWGAVRDLRDLVVDLRNSFAEARTEPPRAPGVRPTPLPAPRATPWLAAIDSAETADRPAPPVQPRPAVAEAPRPAPAPPVRVEMAMRSKEFIPHVQVVPVGGAVAWPNKDPFSHNVFSNTPGGAFDLGLYPRGEARAAGFRRTGVYEVFCNIHPRMSAFVLAVPGPHYAQPTADGRFTIRDVPPGRYRIRAWHERAPSQQQVVTVDANGVSGVRLALDARNYRPTQHANKFGQPYPSTSRDDY